MKKTKTKILTVLVLILLAGIYYYVKLPAINIHADGFWMFLLVVIAAVANQIIRGYRIKLKGRNIL